MQPPGDPLALLFIELGPLDSLFRAACPDIWRQPSGIAKTSGFGPHAPAFAADRTRPRHEFVCRWQAVREPQFHLHFDSRPCFSRR